MQPLESYFRQVFQQAIAQTPWYQKLPPGDQRALQVKILGVTTQTLKGFYSDKQAPVLVAEVRCLHQVHRFLVDLTAAAVVFLDTDFEDNPHRALKQGAPGSHNYQKGPTPALELKPMASAPRPRNGEHFRLLVLDEWQEMGTRIQDWALVYWLDACDDSPAGWYGRSSGDLRHPVGWVLATADLPTAELAEQLPGDQYWPAKCRACGWRGSSAHCAGGLPIADTGDTSELRCPHCGSPLIDEAEDDAAVAEATDARPWTRIAPPLWWAVAGRYIVGDRHLPDGTRQHLVPGHVEPGLIIANAQVIGAADVPDAQFPDALSQLSADRE